MSTEKNKNDQHLIATFKALLKQQRYGSQVQLASALATQGFANVSQTKISRLLSKLGAIKTRNTTNQVVYILPEEMVIPKSKHAIQSIVLSVKHNHVQIILKTGIGGAPLIARMLDNMGESAGILGTLAGDDTIFIAPTDVDRIADITQSIIEMLDVHQN